MILPCTSCNQRLDEEDFFKNSRNHNRRNKSHWCKVCTKSRVENKVKPTLPDPFEEREKYKLAMRLKYPPLIDYNSL